jgi:transketolase
MPSIKPLDKEAVLAAARESGAIVTVEEGTVNGGLGGAVCELLSEECPTLVRRLGAPDEFPPTGSETWILDHYGMSAEGIAHASKEIVSRCK